MTPRSMYKYILNSQTYSDVEHGKEYNVGSCVDTHNVGPHFQMPCQPYLDSEFKAIVLWTWNLFSTWAGRTSHIDYKCMVIDWQTWNLFFSIWAGCTPNKCKFIASRTGVWLSWTWACCVPCFSFEFPELEIHFLALTWLWFPCCLWMYGYWFKIQALWDLFPIVSWHRFPPWLLM